MGSPDSKNLEELLTEKEPINEQQILDEGYNMLNTESYETNMIEQVVLKLLVLFYKQGIFQYNEDLNCIEKYFDNISLDVNIIEQIVWKLLVLLYKQRFLQYNEDFRWIEEYFNYISLDEDMKSVLESPDYTIVRKPYKGQDIFLIGCGHKPATNCGGYLHETQEDECEYHIKHSHDEAYTIDANIVAHPDMVGNVETATYQHIPNESIEQVIIEGASFVLTDIFMKEMYRIMKNGAQCYNESNNIYFIKIGEYIHFESCKSAHFLNGYPDIFDIVLEGFSKCDYGDECECFYKKKCFKNWDFSVRFVLE